VLPVVELLLMVSCPVKAPAVVGLNCSCSTSVWVGSIVTGKPPPTMVKPAPVIEPEFTVTGVVPDDVSVNVSVVAVFTATLPKLRLGALTVNCGFAAVPVPLKATTAVLPVVELLLIVSCPVKAPTVVGLNCTCSVNDCVGFKVTGKL
jgi:hypothetical protein